MMLFWCIVIIVLSAHIAPIEMRRKSFDADNDVIYELYTKDGPSHYQRLQPAYGATIRTDTTFNPDRPTRIFIHGFLAKRKTFERYTAAYLNNGDFNFIIVNWLKGSSTYNYIKARGRVDELGMAVADFIDYLVMNGMNLKDLIVVGHSLGAHIAGIAGKNVRAGRIPIIVGLDPAAPLFSKSAITRRLCETDADIVQVIHTTGGQLSITYPMGLADFYPNAGKDQPGCDGIMSDKCSHGRAHQLFLASLYPNNTFVGIQCESYDEITRGLCTKSGPDALMGGDYNKLILPRGIYYLETNPDPPYPKTLYTNIIVREIM